MLVSTHSAHNFVILWTALEINFVNCVGNQFCEVIICSILIYEYIPNQFLQRIWYNLYSATNLEGRYPCFRLRGDVGGVTSVELWRLNLYCVEYHYQREECCVELYQHWSYYQREECCILWGVKLLHLRGVIIPALKLLPAWRLLHLVRPFLSILLEVQTAERKELFKEKLIAVSSQPKWRTCVVKLRGEEPACRLNMKLPGELWSWLRLLLAWKLVYIWNIGEPYFLQTDIKLVSMVLLL